MKKKKNYFPEIKNIKDWINHINEKLGYIPTLPEFPQLNFQPDGPFKLRQISEIVQKNLNSNYVPTPKMQVMLKILTESYDDMLDALRNYAKLKDSNISADLNQNQKTVQSLRGQIEILIKQNE